MTETLRTRSVIPGRIRWEVPQLRETRGLAEEVERLLAADESIVEVKANPLSAGLLVRYEAPLDELTVAGRVAAAVEEAMAGMAARGAELRRAAIASRRREAEAAGRALVLAAGAVTGSLIVAALLPVSPIVAALGFGAAAVTANEVSNLFRDGGSGDAIGQSSALLEAEVRAAKPFRRAVLLGAGFGVAQVLLSLSRFLVIGGAVNLVVQRAAALQAGVAVPGFLPQMLLLAGAGLVLTAIQAACGYAGQVLWRNVAQNIQHRLQVRLYEHAQRLDIVHFEGRDRAAVLAVLYQEVRYVEGLFGAAWELLRIGTNTVLISIAFFIIVPEIAWISILTIPLLLRSSAIIQKRVLPLYETAGRSASLLAKNVTVNLDGIATIKALNVEQEALQRIRAASADYRDKSREANSVGAIFTPLIELETMAGTVATMVGGGLLISSRYLTPGSYASLIMLMGQLFWPLSELGRILDTLQRALASSRRVHALLDTPVEQTGPPAFLRRPLRGAIEFRDVHFAYPGESRVLAGLSLRAEPGQSIAVVGPTGSGKSTLVKLLLRFYLADRGQILLDGEDIRGLNAYGLRRAVGVVTQDTTLFPGTIRENIALGRPGSTDGEIAEAARRAAADTFIARLPHGLDTRIGERGQALSGGQRQRLAIARIFLRDPHIAVLDEATSHVDNSTEAYIQSSFRTFFDGRTRLIIAHRLAPVRHVDRIYVLDQGVVRESGTHDELIGREGIYAALWRLQTGRDEAGAGGEGGEV